MTDEEVCGNIPEHDLLVGGFPCQDYSVARTLRNEGGIRGKKGVWWNIHASSVHVVRGWFCWRTSINCSSPQARPGDGILPSCSAPSRILRASPVARHQRRDYGMPQRRRRVFVARRVGDVVALHKDESRVTHLLQTGPFAQSFLVSCPQTRKSPRPLEHTLHWPHQRTSPRTLKRTNRPSLVADEAVDQART